VALTLTKSYESSIGILDEFVIPARRGPQTSTRRLDVHALNDS